MTSLSVSYPNEYLELQDVVKPTSHIYHETYCGHEIVFSRHTAEFAYLILTGLSQDLVAIQGSGRRGSPKSGSLWVYQQGSGAGAVEKSYGWWPQNSCSCDLTHRNAGLAGLTALVMAVVGGGDAAVPIDGSAGVFGFLSCCSALLGWFSAFCSEMLPKL